MFKKVMIGFLVIMSLFLTQVETASAEDEVKKCSWSWCISSTDFTISIKDLGVGWWKIGGVDVTSWNSTEETMWVLLGVIIKNLIVIFWVLSLLTMTIGWGYMIFHSGDDSLLSRWKSIFMYGLVSLAIALSSGLIVQLVTFILY